CAKAAWAAARSGCTGRPASAITTHTWTTGNPGSRKATRCSRAVPWVSWATPAMRAARPRTSTTASTAPTAPSIRCRCCAPATPLRPRRPTTRHDDRRRAQAALGSAGRAAPPHRTEGIRSMDKRFWICGIVVAAAALLLGVVVHGLLLRADYQALATLYRTQDQANAHA